MVQAVRQRPRVLLHPRPHQRGVGRSRCDQDVLGSDQVGAGPHRRQRRTAPALVTKGLLEKLCPYPDVTSSSAACSPARFHAAASAAFPPSKRSATSRSTKSSTSPRSAAAARAAWI